MEMMKRYMNKRHEKARRAPEAYELYEAGHRIRIHHEVPSATTKPYVSDTKHAKTHRTLDAYQLYELEHKVRTVDMVSSNLPSPKGPKAGTSVRQHGKPHRPRDAYQLYEDEHRLRTYERVPSVHSKLPGPETVNIEGSIDSRAEKFLAMNRRKFELSRMSTNAYDYEY